LPEAPGDPWLDLHIPSGSPLDMDACLESMRRAREFFRILHPDRTFKIAVCESWLLDLCVKQTSEKVVCPTDGDGVMSRLEGRDWPVPNRPLAVGSCPTEYSGVVGADSVMETRNSCDVASHRPFFSGGRMVLALN
jgi:hypothetical protein